jgi:Domain of unknown function (DUF3883)
MDWSRVEVEAIVADYLRMLTMELAGQSYVKSEHRKHLLKKLVSRSDAAVEFKHANISAAMIDLGFPYINGYKPRRNYQRSLLEPVIIAQLSGHIALDETALAAVQQPAITPALADFSSVKTVAPKHQQRVSLPGVRTEFKAVKRDYLEREAQNRSLGFAGEEFVVMYEHWRLNALGETRLADRVEHVAKTKGDGLGYDVLSFEMNGMERLIEVKTTSFGKETPFYVTKGELARSQVSKDQFHLYRLFEFRKKPRLFDLSGEIEHHCELDAVTYRASFS